MASTETATQTTPPQRRAAAPPKRLKDWQVVLYTAALPTAFLMFCWGVFCVWTLTDPEQKSWLSKSTAAEFARWLISKNTAFLAIPFNGGMFGFILSLDALRKHALAGKPAAKKLSRQERRHPENAKVD